MCRRRCCDGQRRTACSPRCPGFSGVTLPTWTGCRTLRDEVFLLGDTPDSFDGRYWGPTSVELIEGAWRAI
ncbi:MAG: S26 family signal peptidase [Hyphomonadaceae bacterium]|nr:S26 family signal peptidase [Hyphomonadaceae bacterium]